MPFTCGDRSPIPVRARGRHLVVDIHCHLGVPAADALVRAAYPNAPAGLPFSNPHSDAVNAAQFARIGRALNGVDQRLADMDRLGIDVQAMSPNPGQYN
ncbi:MAG: amidohydrolase, partial [Lysobacteraceae bacterium]